MEQLTLNDLIIELDGYVSEDLFQAWDWLISKPLDLVMITKLGDAFLVDPKTQEIYFLDTIDGELETIAPSIEKFQELLQDEEFLRDYFSLDLLLPVLHTELPKHTVFNFETPPVLGGEASPEALQLFDLQQHFDELGHLWHELSKIEDDLDAED